MDSDFFCAPKHGARVSREYTALFAKFNKRQDAQGTKYRHEALLAQYALGFYADDADKIRTNICVTAYF